MPLKKLHVAATQVLPIGHAIVYLGAESTPPVLLGRETGREIRHRIEAAKPAEHVELEVVVEATVALQANYGRLSVQVADKEEYLEHLTEQVEVRYDERRRLDQEIAAKQALLLAIAVPEAVPVQAPTVAAPIAVLLPDVPDETEARLRIAPLSSEHDEPDALDASVAEHESAVVRRRYA